MIDRKLIYYGFFLAVMILIAGVLSHMGVQFFTSVPMKGLFTELGGTFKTDLIFTLIMGLAAFLAIKPIFEDVQNKWQQITQSVKMVRTKKC